MTASVKLSSAKKLAPLFVGCALALSLAPVGCASDTADSDASKDDTKVAETVEEDEAASTDAAEGFDIVEEQ